MENTYDTDLLELPFPDCACLWDTDAEDYSMCGRCPGYLSYCRYEPLPNEAGFFRLIDAMAEEINLLEAEIVRTRQALAEYLPKRWAEGLRSRYLL